MKTLLFIIPQLIGVAVLYFIYDYAFASFEMEIAWPIFSVVTAFYLAYFVHDLNDLLKYRKRMKNFKW